MTHRHLQENEIDLLLDGEVGFGVAPLRAHVAECDACRAAVERERAVFEALERVPHFSPSPQFMAKVMADTRVFEPWYVTALDTARGWIPSSRPARLAAALTFSIASVVMTALVMFGLTRADQLIFFGQLAIQRTRAALLAGARDALESALGSDVATSLGSTDPSGLVLIVLAAAVTAVLSAAVFKRLAATSRRTRE